MLLSRCLFSGLLALLMSSLVACEPEAEQLTSDANAGLVFSEPAVIFDTVFTTLRSATRRLRVYNPHSKALLIEGFQLGGGGDSPFSVLVNGQPAGQFGNFRLAGGDSLTLLVTIQPPPQNIDTVNIYFDSLLVRANGRPHDVKLLAWGQDVTFVRGGTLACNAVWSANKPYLLYDSVRVAAGCQLTVAAGARIFGYTGATLAVNGTLKVEGDSAKPVLFSGFRQERAYRSVPGQWNGIYFSGSSRNSALKDLEVRNAVDGISIQNTAAALPDLRVEHAIVRNLSDRGIRSVNADLRLNNVLISNCGGYLFSAEGGGTYQLNHVTIANYSYDLVRQPVTAVRISSQASVNGTEISQPVQFTLQNSIVWSPYREDFTIEPANVTVTANNNLLRTQLSVFSGSGNLLNVDPKFIRPGNFNFRPDTLSSPALNAGLPGLLRDLPGKSRSDAPDLGAYEY